MVGSLCYGAPVLAQSEARHGAAAEADGAVLQADRQLEQAIAKADGATARRLLDDQFEWIDRVGVVRAKPDAIKDATSGLAGAATDVQARAYGQLGIVTGTQQNANGPAVRFLHVWVRRPAGWRGVFFQHTEVRPDTAPAAAAAPTRPGAGSAPCENPCHAIPFKPASPAEQEVVEALQRMEAAASTSDVDQWAPNMADEFVLIRQRFNGQPSTKAERVAEIRAQKVSGRSTVPGPVQSMRVWVYGDAALMTAQHVSATAERRPYHGTRVWVKRNGRWQLALSQQTSIESPGGPAR
jgi:hypothetical protein